MAYWEGLTSSAPLGWAGDQDQLSGLALGGSLHDLIMLSKKKIFFFKPVDDSLQRKTIGFPLLKFIKT